MLVLLVRPDQPEVESERKRIGLRHQPVGLLCLATVLDKAGFDVRIVDEVLRESTEKEILKQKPDVVGISVPSRFFRRSCEITRFAHDHGAMVILGGPHPTAMPEQSLEESEADAVVVGEGEYTLMELLTTKDWHNVRGILFKENGRIVRTPPRPLIENLDELPLPNRRLLRLERYRLDSELGHYVPRSDRLIRLMATRGCPYQCTFCATHSIFGRRVRFRSPENVVEEIRQCVKDFNAHNFAFIDDTMTVKHSYTIELCEAILRSGLRIRWSCLSRVGVNDDVLKLMRRAGCVMLGFGIESGSPVVLEWIKKEIDIPEVIDTLRRVKKHGFVTKTFWIVGLPREGEPEYRESVELAKKLNPDFLLPCVFLPLPGSEEYERVVKMELESNWDRITRAYNDSGIARARQRRFLRQFYFRPGYLKNVIRHLCGPSVRQYIGILRAFVLEGFKSM